MPRGVIFNRQPPPHHGSSNLLLKGRIHWDSKVSISLSFLLWPSGCSIGHRKQSVASSHYCWAAEHYSRWQNNHFEWSNYSWRSEENWAWSCCRDIFGSILSGGRGLRDAVISFSFHSPRRSLTNASQALHTRHIEGTLTIIQWKSVTMFTLALTPLWKQLKSATMLKLGRTVWSYVAILSATQNNGSHMFYLRENSRSSKTVQRFQIIP